MSTEENTPGKSLEALIQALPPELQKEVKDFAEFLLERKVRGAGKFLGQSWAGSLRGFRDPYTSLNLQKKALEWRGD
jgi:hypothetical protein